MHSLKFALNFSTMPSLYFFSNHVSSLECPIVATGLACFNFAFNCSSICMLSLDSRSIFISPHKAWKMLIPSADQLSWLPLLQSTNLFFLLSWFLLLPCFLASFCHTHIWCSLHSISNPKASSGTLSMSLTNFVQLCLPNSILRWPIFGNKAVTKYSNSGVFSFL